MKQFVLVLSVLLSAALSWADVYPKNPDLNLTPGSTCDKPDSYRYPERIPYCNRDVETELKKEIIRDYNHKLGYKIQTRAEYKIDHFIPLCMGGSNHKDNLWPQHRTVYTITDNLEFIACEKMKEGRLTQKRAIELLREAKLNLKRASAIESQINQM
ncbi:MAG: HNH endonuclease signature motif containing protein [Pseudobdellovibrionaceae bacterium]